MLLILSLMVGAVEVAPFVVALTVGQEVSQIVQTGPFPRSMGQAYGNEAAVHVAEQAYSRVKRHTANRSAGIRFISEALLYSILANVSQTLQGSGTTAGQLIFGFFDTKSSMKLFASHSESQKPALQNQLLPFPADATSFPYHETIRLQAWLFGTE